MTKSDKQKKILIVDFREEGFEMEKQAFSKANLTLVIYDYKDEDELIEMARDAYIVIFTSAKITEKVINNLFCCRMLIRYGVGLDNVDIPAATRRGIYVCNTPDYGTYAVAEHAFSLLMCVNRRIAFLDKYVRNSNWDINGIPPVRVLKDKTLGLVGFGNIGRNVCKMAIRFQMKVIVYDPFVDNDLVMKYGAEAVSFDHLITRSDHISLHLPLTKDTFHLFSKQVFNMMKKGSFIINTSRGGLINQDELIFALKSGQIGGAGLDVFENEPLSLESEFLKMDNVILTPHVAWYTQESIVNLHCEVIDEVLRVIQGEEPQNAVNDISKYKYNT